MLHAILIMSHATCDVKRLRNDSLPSRLFALGDPGGSGCGCFTATPFTLGGELDEVALARHVAPICASADCVVGMGAIAEVDYLTDDEWRRAWPIAGDTVPDGIPLIVGLPGDRRAGGAAGRRDRRSPAAGGARPARRRRRPCDKCSTIADRAAGR